MSEKLKKLIEEADILSREGKWQVAADKWEKVAELVNSMLTDARSQHYEAIRAQFTQAEYDLVKAARSPRPLTIPQIVQKGLWEKLAIAAGFITALALLIGALVALWDKIFPPPS